MTIKPADLGLNARQLAYARRIIARIKARKLPADQGQRAADIALAVGLVESNLTLYANGNNPASLKLPHDAVGWDHGSVGIFQQQVGGAKNSTANWGTVNELMNVETSTDKFVNALLKKNWLHMSNGAAAQAVQGSAFPSRYAARDAQAIRIRKALWDDTNPSTSKPPAKPAAPKPTPPAKPSTYKVLAGDTLGKIADRFDTTVNKLISLNRAKYPRIGTGADDHVEAGWTVRVR